LGTTATPARENAGSAALFSPSAAGKIQHIVYIVQEGRSFNTLFEGYPGTVSRGELSNGKEIELRPISLGDQYNIDDSAEAMFASCNGTGKIPGTDCRMTGFDKEQSHGGPKYPEYVYVNHEDTKPYFAMAHEWVVGDKMFASQLDGDYVAHQYVIAAQAGRAVGIPDGQPWGCDAPGGTTIGTLTDKRTFGPFESPCFDYQTLGAELESVGLSWRYYTSTYDGTPYFSIKGFLGSPGSKKHIVTPQKRFFSDVAAGKLANFTWITPPCPDSDRSSCGGGYGPSWVAALVNTVGKSKFWDSTAIFVQWADWGGFYDNAPPPYKNFDSLGFRVPLLVISPYAKHDYVSHVQYETASVLRFAEDIYALPHMAAADRRATSPAVDCFDFSQKPRTFVRIPAPKSEKFFMHQHD